MADDSRREQRGADAPLVTYDLPLGGVLPIVGGGVMVLVGLGLLAFLLPGRFADDPGEAAWLGFGGGALVVAGIVIVMQRLKYPARRVRLGPDGVIPVGRDGDEPVVPWREIVGGRRSNARGATLLADAGGEVRIAIDDRLNGVEQCLARIADEAAFERPMMPARFAVRGMPSTWWLGIGVAVVAILLVAFRVALDVPGIVFAVVLLVVLAWFAAQEPTALEYDDSGLSIRRVTGSERYGWEEVRDAVFQVRTSRNSRWVETRLVTARGVKRFLPQGAPMMSVVADLRARLRARR